MILRLKSGAVERTVARFNFDPNLIVPATGTFTLSNLGMFGVDRFDAILPPGQVSDDFWDFEVLI